MKQFVLPFEPKGGEPEKRALTGQDFKYLIRVRRYRGGDSIAARSPNGRPYEIRILSISRDSCEILIEPGKDSLSNRSEENFRIVLMPALTKGRKMDLVVRQAVESGAVGLWPLQTDHSQVRYDHEKDGQTKTDRWNRIAKEALQQSGGSTPLTITNSITLSEAVDAWNRRGPLFFFHEKALKERGLHNYLSETNLEIGIIIGPEGGLSAEETLFLENSGAIPIYLGPRILRAETAALYAVAAISTIIRERNEWQPM